MPSCFKDKVLRFHGKIAKINPAIKSAARNSPSLISANKVVANIDKMYGIFRYFSLMLTGSISKFIMWKDNFGIDVYF